MPQSSHAVVDLIFDLFDRLGHEQYGEAITQQQHGVQCAALAERNGDPASLVAASLLHDIGHLLHDLPEWQENQSVDDLHEDLGDAFLREHFPEAVTEPVRLHVAAKRYLCAVEPSYIDGLSHASRQSLALQGGPMSPAECAEFRTNPYWEQAVQLRRYDDAGKDPALSAMDPRRFRAALESSLKPAGA